MTQTAPAHDGLPGRGPLPEQAGTDAMRSDPRGAGISGIDRETLRVPGSHEAAVDPAAGPHPPSEFRAFLDDVSMLVRGRPLGGGLGAGTAGAMPGTGGGMTDQLRARLGERIEDVRGSLSERMEGVRGGLAQVVDRAQDAGARVGGQMQDRLDDARDVVIERPFAAVAAATVAGLLVGIVLAKRR